VTPEREIERICQAALERPRSEREVFLREACLHSEVKLLLAQGSAALALLKTPAFAVAAQLIRNDGHALSVGQQIGVYTIQSALGVGGMGEVYQARDTKLSRDVALKVLLEQFAHDAERLARLEREAQVLASLNHPNIAAIYGG
jgi:eukaryotic-like serine/threonine-protein kinase